MCEQIVSWREKWVLPRLIGSLYEPAGDYLGSLKLLDFMHVLEYLVAMTLSALLTESNRS